MRQEKNSMSDIEYVPYSESELKEAEIRRAIDWAAEQAWKKAYAEGFDKGLAKVQAEGFAVGKQLVALEIAKRLLGMKMDLKSISQACGIDISQLEQLAADM